MGHQEHINLQEAESNIQSRLLIRVPILNRSSQIAFDNIKVFYSEPLDNPPDPRIKLQSEEGSDFSFITYHEGYGFTPYHALHIWKGVIQQGYGQRVR